MNLSVQANSPSNSSRRKPKISGIKYRRYKAPTTPLLHWKFDDRYGSVAVGGGAGVKISARKLAAALLQLQVIEIAPGGGGGGGGDGKAVKDGGSDRPGSKRRIERKMTKLPRHRRSRAGGEEIPGVLQCPQSYCSTKHEIHHNKLNSSSPYPKFALEASTKWDYEGSKRFEHESHRQSSKKKIEQFVGKLERSTEHQKVRAVIKDLKDKINEQKRSSQKMEILNMGLVNQLADAKTYARRIKRDYEEEKRGREIMEEVCNELANQIAQDKAKVEGMKRESVKIRREVEEERNMLQLAEVWREERVHMKMVEAKLALEDKYDQMNKLITDLERFLKSTSVTLDVMDLRRVELIQQTAKSIDIRDVKELSNVPEKSDNLLPMFEDPAEDKENEPITHPLSPNSDLDEGEPEGRDQEGKRSSPKRTNPHIRQGMKGCIEWPRRRPRGIQRDCLKGKLLEERIESQRSQLRHVFKQRVR